MDWLKKKRTKNKKTSKQTKNMNIVRNFLTSEEHKKIQTLRYFKIKFKAII